MILLYGIPTEGPISLAVTALNRLHANYALLDQRTIGDVELIERAGYPVALRSNKLGMISLDAIDCACIRPTDFRALPEYLWGSEHNRRRIERIDEAIWSLFDLIPAKVINRPSSMLTNMSKPLQTILLARYGFSTPRTIVTNDADRAAKFIASAGPDCIYKSASGERSTVRPVSDGLLERMTLGSPISIQIQKFVPGDDIRVHVVGDQVLATAIRSARVDYRDGSNEAAGVHVTDAGHLPERLAIACVDVTKDLGLHFSGIDLRIGPDGTVFCFEVNPSPGYSYFERGSGQDISGTLARFMLSHV